MTTPNAFLPPEATAATRPCERKTVMPSADHGPANTGSIISETGIKPPGKTGVYNLTGLLLISIYLLQAIWPLHWPWLFEMQKDELYKQLTGLILALLVIHQWRLSWLRSKHGIEACRRQCLSHQKMGAIAPLLFYMHSVQLGHAYLALLSGIFLGVVLLGLFNPSFLKLRNRWFIHGWLILHVAGSVMLLLLMVSHVYFAFYYE